MGPPPRLSSDIILFQRVCYVMIPVFIFLVVALVIGLNYKQLLF